MLETSFYLSAALRRAGMTVFTVAGASLLGACAALDRPLRTPDVTAAVRAELPPVSPPAPAAVPAKVSEALAEPAPPQVAPPPEPRLDLLVNNANAREVFLAIVADTRYSMLMHPDVAGTLSVTLRGVTVTEALEAIRDVYGYDFKIEGRRITIFAPTLQTRVFTINYPTSQRTGSSDLRVSGGGGMQSTTAGTSTSTTTPTTTSAQSDGSRVSTTSNADFWSELAASVRSLVGTGTGRNVVSSPQAGILVVRAMPEELRQVDKYLKAAQASVERQVMLEAKVVEVELRDGYQSGINWGAFGSDVNGQAAVGVVGSGVNSTNPFVQGTTVINGAVAFPSMATGGGLLGLALATSQFGAVLGFLETQGDVQTLSSPRIATLNNQKAVLKVGSDEFYVTGVTGGTSSTASSTSSTSSSTMPTVTLTPFFSGISLDVTPQIDDGVNVTLHIHPSLTTVTEKTKQVDLGSVGNYRLPLASSSVNESDTLVRIQDGAIVAIGGLMQLESSRNASGVPGTTQLPGLSALFGNRATQGRKKEVIVLIKPTIIRTAADWEAQTQRTRSALDDMDAARARVIKIDGDVPAK
jgi:MSHA biogenesis protein MshL